MLTETVNKKEYWELEHTLFEQIEYVKSELSRLTDRFNFENDPVRIDELIYNICAVETRYRALLERARQKAS